MGEKPENDLGEGEGLTLSCWRPSRLRLVSKFILGKLVCIKRKTGISTNTKIKRLVASFLAEDACRGEGTFLILRNTMRGGEKRGGRLGLPLSVS